MNFVSDTWTYETSLTLPHFIEMPGEWAVMYMCAKGIHFEYLSVILRLDCGNVPTV